MSNIKIQTVYESNVQQGVQLDTMALQSLQTIAGNTNTMCKLLAGGLTEVTTTLNTMQGGLASTTSNMSRLAASQTKVSSASRQASSGMRETAKSINQASSSAHASKGSFGNLWSSLMRIAKLRFLRGIIRSITQGFSEGVGNIYQYSKALGGIDASNVSGSLNSIASSFLYLKNSIGAAVAPLLQAVVPVLSTIVNWAVLALNAIGKLFAILSGKTTMTVAKKQATQWKDTSSSIGGATKAAKEYQNTILGFDELNVLNDTPSTGGGGGGGGASAPDYGDMFEEVPIKAEGLYKLIKQLYDKLKPIVSKIASFMGQQISDGIESISAAFLALDGVLNGEPKKIERAFDAMQNVLKNNKFVNTLYKMALDIERWFSVAWINVRKAFVTAFKGIATTAKSVFAKLYGEDFANILFDPLIGKLEDTEKALEDDKKKANDFYDAMAEWADGKRHITVIKDETGKLQYKIQKLTGAAEGAKKGIEAIGKTKGIDKVSEQFSTTAANAEKISTKTKGARDSINELNRLNPNFSKINSGLATTSTKAGDLAYKAKLIHDRLLKLNEIRVKPEIKATMTIQQAAQQITKGIEVRAKAKGGFVERFDGGGFKNINTADVFVANENARPELVGRIGNRTAVANQGQMVDALAQGVAEGFMAAQGGNENVEFNVYLDRTRLAQAVTQGQRNLNRRYNVAVR